MAYKQFSSGSSYYYLPQDSGAVTGDGTTYTILFDTEIINYADEYDVSTGIFTPSVNLPELTAGYTLSVQIALAGITALNTGLVLYIYDGGSPTRILANFNPFACANGDGTLSFSASCSYKMFVELSSVSIVLKVTGDVTPNVSIVGQDPDNFIINTVLSIIKTSD